MVSAVFEGTQLLDCFHGVSVTEVFVCSFSIVILEQGVLTFGIEIKVFVVYPLRPQTDGNFLW